MLWLERDLRTANVVSILLTLATLVRRSGSMAMAGDRTALPPKLGGYAPMVTTYPTTPGDAFNVFTMLFPKFFSEIQPQDRRR